MAIQSIMKTRLVVIGPDETVAAAAKRMSESNLGALLVVENDKLLGIFSERDLLVRVAAAGKELAATKVRDVTTFNPITVSANAQIMDCYRIIKDHSFRHLPVVNEHGKPVGIMSARDFLQFMVLGLEGVTDMTPFYEKIGSMKLDIYGAGA